MGAHGTVVLYAGNAPGVSNLVVAAPTNALSTLLLNYTGLATPLRVLNACTIGTNGTIDNFAGSFEVRRLSWTDAARSCVQVYEDAEAAQPAGA